MTKSFKIQIAKNYAKALFELADSEDKKNRLVKDCHALKNFLPLQKDIKFLSNPKLKENQQKSILRDIATILNLSQTSLRFLEILLQNSRLDLLFDICSLVEDMALKDKGFIKVEVETAQNLSDKQKEKLQTGLEKKLQKSIILSYKLNQKLLGGLIVRYHSFQIDDSLEYKLNTLEQVMKG